MKKTNAKKEKLKKNTNKGITLIGVRIDIWTHLMRGCIMNYVY